MASNLRAVCWVADSAMRIFGQEELAFVGETGSGVAFWSALWHRIERASADVLKMALFYGYLLWVQQSGLLGA